MQLALEQARLAASRGEVPVGAVIVSAAGEVLAADGNRTREQSDPTAHAEMLVIRQAARKLQDERLPGCDLYVTLEPCPMCAGAISFARLRRVYFGAADPKSGGVERGPPVFSHPTCDHRPEGSGGLPDTASAALPRQLFPQTRCARGRLSFCRRVSDPPPTSLTFFGTCVYTRACPDKSPNS